MREVAQRRPAPNRTEAVEITVHGRTSLRLTSWLPEYTNAAKPVVLAGRELPLQVGATLPGPMRVLCIGPGEWLIVSHKYSASSLRERIEPDLQKYGLVLADLTDGLAGLDVRGSAVREVLSKGCGLDLHPRTFPAERCARTRFAQIPLIIECLDHPHRFELHVARSYFQYLHAWLTDATAEFGDTVT